MSVLDEPSELTPLRRINLRQQQSQSTNRSEQQQEQQQLTLSSQTPTQAPASRSPNQSENFNQYITINNNNTIIHSGESSDITNSDLNTINGKNMSDTSRILTRITIDFAILLTGESFSTKNFDFQQETQICEHFRQDDCFGCGQQRDMNRLINSNDFKASIP